MLYIYISVQEIPIRLEWREKSESIILQKSIN